MLMLHILEYNINPLCLGTQRGKHYIGMNNKLNLKQPLIIFNLQRLNLNKIIVSLKNSRVDDVCIIGFMYL